MKTLTTAFHTLKPTPTTQEAQVSAKVWSAQIETALQTALYALGELWLSLHQIRRANWYSVRGRGSFIDYVDHQFGLSQTNLRQILEAAEVAHDLLPASSPAHPPAAPDAQAIQHVHQSVRDALERLEQSGGVLAKSMSLYGIAQTKFNETCRDQFGLNPTQCQRVIRAAQAARCRDQVKPLPPSSSAWVASDGNIGDVVDYLSIDLDFWCKGNVDADFLHQVLSQVPKTDRIAATEHDSILPHLRRYGQICTRLINLDYHSDLGGVVNVAFENGDADDRRLELHSGSWGDYVHWRDREQFVWVYPDQVALEDGRTDHFNNADEVPFSQIPQHHEHFWWKLTCREGRAPDYGVDLTTVRAVAIVLSPAFCGPDASSVIEELVRRFEVSVIDRLP